MHMKVSAAQFAREGDRLVHAPSGTAFWLDDNDDLCCEEGRLTRGGNDYRLDELKDQAWLIMRQQKLNTDANSPSRC